MDPSIDELRESNKDLVEAVSSFHITNEEYAVLESLGDKGMMDPKKWLGPAPNANAVTINKTQAAMLRAPYQDMPLHINSDYKPICLMARWRLKIGR